MGNRVITHKLDTEMKKITEEDYVPIGSDCWKSEKTIDLDDGYTYECMSRYVDPWNRAPEKYQGIYPSFGVYCVCLETGENYQRITLQRDFQLQLFN